MTDMVRNESDLAKGSVAPVDEKGSKLHIYVVGAIVLAFASLLAYQFLFCAGCYM